jgi:acetolactate synthase-1/2/3 large subunit
LLVECLIRAGIKHIFGLPGDTSVVLYDALYERSADIDHVLVRDERHAASAADAYARVTNKVGAVEVSSGGGTTYVVGGLGEAFAASVPVLLITSDVQTSSRGTGALTEIDQERLFSAVTKWSAVASSPAQIPALAAQAIRQATHGRPAPVALIIPEEILDQTIPSTNHHRLPQAQLPAERSEADPEAVQRAGELLSQASRPAILAGSGIHCSRAYGPLAELASQLGVPVATSIHGKGAISDLDDWSLGTAGNNGGRDTANAYLASADVVLLIGTRANATDTNGWTAPPRDSGCVIVQADIDGVRAGRNFPGALPLVGDAATVLQQLLHVSESPSADVIEARRRLVREANQTWQRAQDLDSAGMACREGEIPPATILMTAQRIMGPDTIVIADPGTPTPNLAAYWQVRIPGRTAIAPRGHGPMGYAIPASIGAAFAAPGQRILVLTTDGSVPMSVGALETAARFQLPITFVNFNNFGFGWIKMLQHLYMDGRCFGVDPGPVDAVLTARAAGLHSVHVSSPGDLSAALQYAAAAEGPMLIDCTVPDLLRCTPPVSSWFAALAGEKTRPTY